MVTPTAVPQVIPTATPTGSTQPTTAPVPQATQRSLTQADVDGILGVGNWFCFPDRQDGIGVVNLPSSFVVQSPLEYVDTHTGSYTVGQVVPVIGGATAQLQGILPRAIAS